MPLLKLKICFGWTIKSMFYAMVINITKISRSCGPWCCVRFIVEATEMWATHATHHEHMAWKFISKGQYTSGLINNSYKLRSQKWMERSSQSRKRHFKDSMQCHIQIRITKWSVTVRSMLSKAEIHTINVETRFLISGVAQNTYQPLRSCHAHQHGLPEPFSFWQLRAKRPQDSDPSPHE
jgi:hypothetical protein